MFILWRILSLHPNFLGTSPSGGHLAFYSDIWIIDKAYGSVLDIQLNLKATLQVVCEGEWLQTPCWSILTKCEVRETLFAKVSILLDNKKKIISWFIHYLIKVRFLFIIYSETKHCFRHSRAVNEQNTQTPFLHGAI